MKRILLASVAALGLAGTASAADLAVAPVAYVPAFTWTSCYLGINGGWIGSNEDYTSRYQNPVTAFPLATRDTNNSYGPEESAGTAGGQFGCQAQLGSWVIGGEWDFNWSGLKEDNTFFFTDPNGTFGSTLWQYTHKQMDWFTTARAKLGLAWDRILIYGTGGLAYASFEGNTAIDVTALANTPAMTGTYDERRLGWVVGGGLEWAFANNWSAKAEFLYMDFGSFSYISPATATAIANGLAVGSQWKTEVDAKEYVARVGINYLFHPGGAPVVARY